MNDNNDNCNYYRSSIVWLFLVPALGGFLFGYDIGATSFVIVQLASFSINGSQSSLSCSVSLMDSPLKKGWIVSSPSAGALLGTAILMYVDGSGTTSRLKPIGRKTELRYAGILYFIGGLLEYISGNYNYNSIEMSSLLSPFVVLSVGRWIYGIGIGFAMHGGPTYLAETTPSSIRGMMVGGKEIAIVCGILAGYFVGYQFTTTTDTDHDTNENGWTYVYGATLCGSLLMIGLSYIIPESARWIASQPISATTRTTTRSSVGGNTEVVPFTPNNMNEEEEKQIMEEVHESLKFLWKPLQARKEHDTLMEIRRTNIQEQADDQNHSNSSSLVSLLLNRKYRPALIAGLGLVILQQITGQPSVLSYATPILAEVPGLGNNSSVILALFKVVATTISVLFVETRGRKTLLFIGCTFMTIALLVLTVAFQTTTANSGDGDGDNGDGTTAQPQSLDTRSYLVILGMFAYIAGYQIGFGPITWLMISEVFPQSIRTQAVAVSVQLNFALNALVQFVVPILQTHIGLPSLFGIFGLLSLYSIYFIHHYILETKGLSLEEIEYQFRTRVSRVQPQQQQQYSQMNDNDNSNTNQTQQVV
eukprot:CAMPEP_0170836220 /NCGR_PEP_ID=MMETSP0734-20130129/2060_1 /TAXON_ID=186038 /ORGANISM="Fragilariopsis kerguelensis, Strain L26-C5" /LENGTH=589 /DNA_ID=CAMNT_0011203211 /DNA_START=135 /DNA_END=1904 /DNA_ORIENTATION=-